MSEQPSEQDALNCYNYKKVGNEGLCLLRAVIGNTNPFQDRDIYCHYQNFRIKSVHKLHAFIWVALLLLFSYGVLISFVNYGSEVEFMRVLLVLRVVICLTALFIHYNIFCASVSHLAEKARFQSYVRFVTTMSDIVIMCNTFVNCAAYVWKSSLGSCLIIENGSAEVDTQDSYYYNCNPSYEIGGTPMNSMILLIIGNIYIVMTLRCHSSWSVRVSYFTTCISTIAAAALSPDGGQSFLVILCSFLLIIIYEDIESNSLVMFNALLDLEMMKRIQARELKIFIGNVAHDLKTPLHGMSMCMDHLLMDCRDGLSKTQAIRSSNSVINLQNTIDTMELCKANCSFMSAAISRTVDFTKSASNIALNATMETVSITNAMQWALTCLSNVQTRIPIKVMPLPPGVCEYVVTDKHWLMENILCYLSNATKYSASGTITISASLEDDASSSGSTSSDRPAKEDTGMIEMLLKTMHINNTANAEDDDCVASQNSDYDGKPRLQMLCFAVEDEGIGVEDSKKASLFKPFRQTMRLAGGTGLGLYSLSKRVEVLRGKYGVGNRLDGRPGSRFWFTIPYVPDEGYCDLKKSQQDDRIPVNILKPMPCALEPCNDQENASVLVKEEPPISTERGIEFSSGEISSTAAALVVEDSAVISKATARMLTKAGYTVDVAENGAIGLEKMKQCVYSVVIMDLQMPIMDGLEATRRIRAFEKESEVESKQFIIAASANGAEDVRQGALESGANVFVSKPFSMQSLNSIMQCSSGQ